MTDERLRRWRLALGPDGADPNAAETRVEPGLSALDLARDRTLTALYGGDDEQDDVRGAALGGSAPRAARWLGDVREYFPSGVVRVMQRDAVERFGLRRLLLEPELLEAAQPDIHLVSMLMSLRSVIPSTRASPPGPSCATSSRTSSAA
jgi:hypothetical protein